ncbi:MAG: ribosome biogenesis GTPase Der [Desulfarculaceae bacterium]|nr:ribosome biogenesis GTPase Der [Desulfarculaceae bacterium]MCF8048461.1 ribosome biogenesis GTPase Der [Desulfarculaceae bacterium]MCF8096945.1 ribosome biogenesis GTPase Der [Desulfarculaceae bacterium]MCF8122639.1 ribosome biogenesis GTPase Der [Desulfarculaceae bacterium]
MTPIVAIVGRPNVGKSTLFNRLTRTRQALVDDLPGVTRDRLYGRAKIEGRAVTLVDTGGFDPPADQAFAAEVHAQIELALQEADVILCLADGRAGLTPQDQEVARYLRRTASKPVVWAVNKVDGPNLEDAAAEFYSLGVDHLFFISAAHARGVPELLETIAELLPPEDEDEALADQNEVRLALVGRPNVGKSSLINRLTGQERVVVSNVPGTTRDAVDTPLEVGGKRYLLIDTAGIRRQGRVNRGLEKAGVFRSLRAVERSHVGAVLVDAEEGITDQDLRLAGHVLDSHRALIVVVNKWDLVAGDEYKKGILVREMEEAMRFAPWAPMLYMSVKTGQGVNKLLPTVDKLFAEYNQRINTGRLNQALAEIAEHHPPPMTKGKRLKIYYGSQVASRPPTVVLMVNDPKRVHFSYRRYLVNELRRALGLTIAPLRLIFRGKQDGKGGKRRP